MKNTIVFSGDLEYLNLGELIQLIGSNGSTGVLRIISKYIETPGFIYFNEGNPIEATAETKSGQEAIYNLFGWTEGEFEFSQEPVTVQQTINQSRMEIILEGLRLLDDNKIEVKGPISFERIEQKSGKSAMPVIKGPMIDYMDVVAEEEYATGDPIVHEGRHGTWMWVILEGEVEIFREIGGKRKKLLKVGPGAFIGSLASFDQHSDVRSATAVAADRVQLGVLDRQRLTQEFSSLPPDFRNIIISMNKRLKQVTDLVVKGAQSDQKQIEKLVKGKTPVLKHGEKQDRLFVIRQGEAFVIKESPERNLMLARLGKNDVVGKIPFINIGHESDSATVYGTDDIKMKAVDLEKLEKDYNCLSGTMINMIENCANFITATTNLAVN